MLDRKKILLQTCIFCYFSGESSICEANIVPIYECFLLALEDYTHDRRGDIGAWVREASMSGLTSLTLLASENPSLVPQICVEAMMPKIGRTNFFINQLKTPVWALPSCSRY